MTIEQVNRQGLVKLVKLDEAARRLVHDDASSVDQMTQQHILMEALRQGSNAFTYE